MLNKNDINFDRAVGYNIGKTALKLKSSLSKKFKANNINITPEQWVVLYHIFAENGQYQQKLADSILKDKPTISRILFTLEDKKLIKRIPDKNDRRKTKVFITEDGEKLIKNIIPVVIGFKTKIESLLTDEEIDNLIKILNKLYKGAEE